MPDYSAIIAAIAEMNDAHKQCIDSFKEELHTGLRGSAVQIEAEMEVVNRRIQELADHVAKQNGSVAELKAESIKREEAVRDFRELEKSIKNVRKNIRSKWMLFLLASVLFVVTIIFIYDMGAFPALFNFLINKVF